MFYSAISAHRYVRTYLTVLFIHDKIMHECEEWVSLSHTTVILSLKVDAQSRKKSYFVIKTERERERYLGKIDRNSLTSWPQRQKAGPTEGLTLGELPHCCVKTDCARVACNLDGCCKWFCAKRQLISRFLSIHRVWTRLRSRSSAEMTCLKTQFPESEKERERERERERVGGDRWESTR